MGEVGVDTSSCVDDGEKLERKNEGHRDRGKLEHGNWWTIKAVLQKNQWELWHDSRLPKRWDKLGVNEDKTSQGNVDEFRRVVRDLIGKVGRGEFKGGEDLELLLDVIGFCRVFVILSGDIELLWPRLHPFSLCDEVVSQLKRRVYYDGDVSYAELESAYRYSLLLPSHMSWEKCIMFANLVCREGGFSHEYSLEEAIFIIHMNPLDVSPFEGSFWDVHKYRRDRLLLFRCFLGGLARVLQEEGRFPADFHFSISLGGDEERLIVDNGVLFLCAFMRHLDSWSGLSEWLRTDQTYWLCWLHDDRDSPQRFHGYITRHLGCYEKYSEWDYPLRMKFK